MRVTMGYTIGMGITLAMWFATDLIAGNQTFFIPVIITPIFIIFYMASKEPKKEAKK